MTVVFCRTFEEETMKPKTNPLRTFWTPIGILLVACSLSLPTSTYSQTTTTGDVTGVVQDESEAVVPNAAITLKDTDTGAARTAMTGGDGRYHFSLLKPGNYELSGTSAGLKSDVGELTPEQPTSKGKLRRIE